MKEDTKAFYLSCDTIKHIIRKLESRDRTKREELAGTLRDIILWPKDADPGDFIQDTFKREWLDKGEKR